MSSARDGARRFPLQLGQIAGPARASTSAARRLLRPQAPLREAAADAARSVAPSGLGLDSAEVRRRMVLRLQTDGPRHPAVLEALLAVPRHLFVETALVSQAYKDMSLPIGHGQTISSPSVIALMLEMLMQGRSARAVGKLGRVLEIGSGCGYQAAVLAQLSGHVISIERIRPLHDGARSRLAALRETRVRLVYGDGMLGHASGAPYDSIIAAAGGDALPQPWLDQLGVGGRLVAPVRMPGGQQMLVVVDRTEQGFERGVHDAVRFVPLRAGLD